MAKPRFGSSKLKHCFAIHVRKIIALKHPVLAYAPARMQDEAMVLLVMKKLRVDRHKRKIFRTFLLPSR